MSSNNYAKAISEKWKSGRDVTDIRNRNSMRLKELRRNKRSEVMNKFRQGLATSAENIPKSAVEKKLDRLKAYKSEKQKKMEELRKKQKPPFCCVVKPRHTGGTPFRDAPPATKTKFVPGKLLISSLSTAVKTRSRTHNPFEFKATLSDTRNIKTVTSRAIEDKEIKKPAFRKNQAPEPQPSSSSSGPSTSSNLSRQRPTRAVSQKKNNEDKENNLLLNDVTNCANVQSGNVIGVSHMNLIKTRQTRGRAPAPASKKGISTSVQNGIKTQTPQIEDKAVPSTNGDIDYEVRKQGTVFHRNRLNNEIDRLTSQSNAWSKRGEENIPEHIKGEILAVVGQTGLLLSQKFRDFSNLVDRCASIQTADDVKVTLEDLEGFWDMMYQQVMLLDKKYQSLQELENNQWQEQVEVTRTQHSNRTAKRVLPNRKYKKEVSSKFRDFLKSKKQPQIVIEKPKTPEPETKGSEMDDSSFYHSANRDVEFTEVPDILKTPKVAPEVQRTINSDRRSRRSSAGLIILRQRILMKSISSPQKNC